MKSRLMRGCDPNHAREFWNHGKALKPSLPLESLLADTGPSLVHCGSAALLYENDLSITVEELGFSPASSDSVKGGLQPQPNYQRHDWINNSSRFTTDTRASLS